MLFPSLEKLMQIINTSISVNRFKTDNKRFKVSLKWSPSVESESGFFEKDYKAEELVEVSVFHFMTRLIFMWVAFACACVCPIFFSNLTELKYLVLFQNGLLKTSV